MNKMIGDFQRSLVEIDPVRETFRVHRDAYRSQEVYEEEIERVFGRCWLYLGHESEVEGSGAFVRRMLAGRDMIMIRDRDDAVKAFYNACPHRGVSLCRDKKGQARVITCPYHGWVFGPDGVLKGFGMQGGYPADFNVDGRMNLVPAERLENYRGFVFVNFDKGAGPLEEYLSGAKDILDLVADQSDCGFELVSGAHEYTIDANYKYLAENSIDGYHPIETHRSYFDFMADRLRETEGQDAVDRLLATYSAGTTGAGLGNGHGWMGGVVPTGRPVASWIPPWGPEAKIAIDDVRARLEQRFGPERALRIAEHQRNLVIFPNLVVNDHVAVTVRMFQPEGPSRMRVTAWALAPKNEHPLLRKIRLDNYLTALGPAGFVTPDDNDMLQLAQHGIEHSPTSWSDLSRGFAGQSKEPGDILTGTGPWDHEAQLRGYWMKWDRMMRAAENANVG